ncbi:fibronectin type III domain-containing protein [Pseudochryseolinea flava]|uniref:Staphylococcus aureus surface protein A n=1 Tax=Pseudochryseolinea flava TaxID=2059302 RepID=A0A364Y360_9BACT|nr:fibronectin type III domain-containing protein [Pseudochryseolinea flava]RAW01343.1 hypothetical protein DQQ10_10585 [Pseudochryseolinea flava]
MKKTYMMAAFQFGAILLSLVFVSLQSRAQNCPPNNTMPEFQNFTYTQVQSWNTSAYASYQYNSPEGDASSWMRFRMISPNGFNRCANDGLKYPLIIMLHGSGESGVYDAAPNNGSGEQDNDKQLTHGGERHRNMVQNGTFPGFVIFPQIRKTSTGQNYWGPDNLKAVRYIIDKLIADFKVDPDRVYLHGLSMGGEGTWIFANLYPTYFAAIHPMSAAGSNFWNGSTGNSENYKTLPIRHAQGGLDGAPTKYQGNEMVQHLRSVGANVRYSYYPNGGHSIWGNEYNKSDFFSWFLSNKKNQIWVQNQQTSFCPGEPFNITLGLTPGFNAYEWVKNSTGGAAFAFTSSITVTQADIGTTYYARFRRTASGPWSEWSAGVLIDGNKGPSATPTVTASGSVNLVPLDGSPEVTLSGPSGKAQYTWSVTPSATLPAIQTITTGTAGSYILQTKDAAGTGLESNGETPTEYRATPQGCLSLGSTPVVVTTSNGFGVPASPGNFFATAASPNSIILNWDDRSSNELGFEIYRTTTPGSGYKLISIRPATATANPQTYTDNTNVQPNTIYYYQMRAVNASGGSNYTPEISVNTAIDNVAPSAPILSLVSSSRTEINLSWTASTDNVGVTEYNVYQNGTLIATVPSSTLTYKATGLVSFSTYNYVVRARDFATNLSAASNQIIASAINAGLYYYYYHHNNNLTSVNQITTNGTFIKNGYVTRFLLSPRTQNDQFAFIYEGFINIPTTGSYTFYTQSDDGSVLYVNNQLVVNNDGGHGCNEKAGTPITLSAGSYPIRALYYEGTGGECLTVRWQGPGIAKAEIPDAAFQDAITPPPSVAAPSNFNSTVASFSQINLTWTDNSNNETGFEISRSASSNGTYVLIATTGPNTTSYAHTGLAPGSTHYYKIRAISANNASALVGPTNKTTSNSPAAPNAPNNLVANAISATQVNLSWNDNSTSEVGYELQRSSANVGTSFVTIATTAANATTFGDTQLTGHSTVYYRVRARGAGNNHSNYTTVVSVTTPNRAPVIQNIPDQSMTASSGTAQTLNITTTDPDNDAIVYTFTTGGSPGLPAGAVFTDDGYGKGVITFTNVVAGAYTIIATASDGLASVNDQFIVTFGSNQPPAVNVTNPSGFVNSLVTEEGRTTPLVFSVTDPNGAGTLTTPTIVGLPTFATSAWTGSNPRLLTLNFSPTVGQQGIYNVSVDFKDNAGGITTKTFTVTVLPVDNFFTVSMNFVYDAAINYTPTYAEAAPWNNTGSPAASDLINLKDDAGNTLRFITFNRGSGWTDGNPPSPTTYLNIGTAAYTGDPNTLYTKKVRESFYRKSGGTSTLTFKNLNPALQYKFDIYGGGPASGTASSTQYLISKAVSQGSGSSNTVTLTLNNTNNTTNIASSGYVFPKSDGTISIAVSRATGVSAGLVYINALVMTAQYPAPAPPIAPSGLTLTAPSFNSVNVSWTDNSFNETGFQIWRATTIDGTYSNVGSVAAEATTFTDTPVAGRTTYYYKVRAVNAYGFNETAPLVVTTPNGAPTINNPGTITVRVGETLQHNISATDPENDAISFSTLNLPSFATLVDNGNGTGFVRLIPQSSDIGSYTFTLRAIDNLAAETETTVSVIVLDAALDEAFFVNFNAGSAADAPAPWNNRALGNSAALTTASGQTSSVSITGSGFPSTSNTVGVNTGNNSGIYPDRVMQSGWINNNTTGGGQITILGLDNNKRYNLTLFGSRDEFWFANTNYVINGITKALNGTKNKSNTVRFTGIQPTSGNIVINVWKGTNLNASPVVAQRDGVINAMILESYTIGTTPRKPTDLIAEGISKTAIKLSWKDNAADETGYEISRATNQAGPFTVITTTAANVEEYTNTALTANTGYIYRVRAMKTTGTPSEYTNNALASTFHTILLVSFNYSSAGGQVQAPNPWNNTAAIPAAGLSFNNLKNDVNTATTVDLSIVSHGSGAGNESGFTPGIYPDNALLNYYFYEQFEAPDQYRLSQLPAGFDYDLVFLGNEWSLATINGVPCATDYTVGTTTLTQFNGRNSTMPSYIRGVKPESDNTIDFYVGTNSGARYGILNTLEIRSYTPLNQVFDTEAPSIPAGLVASNITDEGFQVSWNPSTDNVGVGSYEVYLGSTMVTTVTDTFAILTGLQSATMYSVSVRAVDTKLNKSGFSNALQVTTLNSSTEATLYYPTPSGDITVVGTWGTLVGGGGAHPANFTTGHQHFIIDRNANSNAPWIVTGADSRIIVKNGMTLNINSNIAGTVDLEDNATVYVASALPPSFGVLAPTSTVRFSGSSNAIPGANYGNLTLDGTNTSKSFSSGSYTVNGNLNIADGISLAGSAGNNTVLNIHGNLTLAGATTSPSENELLTLNFVSGVTQSISASQTNALRFNSIHVVGLTQLNVIGGATQKTLSLGSATGGGITIDSGAVLNLGKNKLVIEGTGAVNPLNEKGKITINKGDITINSTGTQISNLSFTTNSDTVNILRLNSNVSGQVNIRSRLYVDNAIDMASGRLNSNDLIVLVSTDTHTARIGKIGNNGSVIGKVEFQRYFDAAGRAYRYVGTPVFNTTVNNWKTYLPVTGPFVGSNNANTTASLFYYDSEAGWIGYPDTNTGTSGTSTMDVGRGYSIFVFQGTTSKKLRISGPIQQGNFTYQNLKGNEFPAEEAQGEATPGNGWNLIANPYASPIEWGNAGWIPNGVNATVYIRTYANGAYSYKQWNGEIGDTDFAGIISQGQSFWVQCTSLDPSLTITEDAKYDAANAKFMRAASPRNYLKVTMSDGTRNDNAYVQFKDDATESFDKRYDGLKLANDYFTLSTVANSKNLGINTLSSAFCSRIIPINIEKGTPGQFSLTFSELASFDFALEAKLIDKFLNTVTPIQDGASYSFEITSDPASTGSGRFNLVIGKPAIDQQVSFTSDASVCGGGTATVNLTSTQVGVEYNIINAETILATFTGNGEAMQVNIDASVLAEGSHHITLQAGFSGCDAITLPAESTITYTKTPAVSIDGNKLVSSANTNNQWLLDGQVIAGATQTTFEPTVSGEYSVSVIGANCSVTSEAIIFMVTDIESLGNESVVLYPNPIRNSRFLIQLNGIPEATPLEIEIINAQGIVMDALETVNQREGIQLSAADFPAGLYTVLIRVNGERIERRFIRE